MTSPDRPRQLRFVLVAVAIAIAAVSLTVSHILVADLQREERARMEIWAQALRALNNAGADTDVSLILDVLQSNNTIPVIVLDSGGHAADYRNVDIPGGADTTATVESLGRKWAAEGKKIRVEAAEDMSQTVCYDESTMIKRLSWYPYVVLTVVLVFVAMALLAVLWSKRAEQNKVWVGLSKETAHQLGTPISSLMAWVEILKETYPDDTLIPEMASDVKRLERIAERFSKIGSLPEPADESLSDLVRRVGEYMDRRTSHRVAIHCDLPDDDVRAMICAPLFEWVIENLCKNAVDAMDGAGSIRIAVAKSAGGRATIDVADTGKGIRGKDIKRVFRPGFTTKKRGWGLGLSLAKRIVEQYHSGKIYVLRSEPGKGTTFRIEI